MEYYYKCKSATIRGGDTKAKAKKRILRRLTAARESVPKMASLKIDTVLLLSALCCLIAVESVSVKSIISSVIPTRNTNTSSSNETSTGSWPQDLQEEIKLWREQNTGKAEPTGILSGASKLVENFLFDDGVPADYIPFSSATPEQVEKKVILHLYTKETKDHNITGPTSSLVSQGFHPYANLTLLIHGYGHDTSGTAIQPIKDRILAMATGPVNVIGVDWGALCPKPHYVWSRSNVKPTGEYLGKWLAELVQHGLVRPADIHIIGHSLGAHVAGTAGATAGKLNVTVARVTGLDPAYPLFARATPESGKVSPADANLVDIIHTAIGRLGLKESVGHVDFYVNGGSVPQPGCGADLSASCSHERVCFLYAESVGKPDSFVARRCPDEQDITEENCTGEVGHMGANIRFGARGKYYVKTEDKSPFDPSSQQATTSGNNNLRQA